MNETGNSSITVTSTARTPEAQANAMATNVKAKGMESQKKLYASAGDKVLDKYPDKKAMVNKINEIGPGKVSKHCADPAVLNVLDVSTWRGGMKNPRSFATEVGSDPRVSRVLSPYNSTDPAIHIEVPQP